MSHVTREAVMARGASGRIVLEVDPELKAELYAALAEDGLTLKEWFLERVRQYLYEDVQLGFEFDQAKAARRG
jgi:hypothetical protein